MKKVSGSNFWLTSQLKGKKKGVDENCLPPSMM